MQKERKNICIDARMMFSAGIGTVIRNILTQLNDSSFKAKTLQNEVPIYSIREQFFLQKKIPECDLFWSPHYNVPVLPIKAKKRIVTIHDINHLAYAKNLGFKEKIYAKAMLRYAVHKSDAVITSSEFSRSEISKYLSISKEKIDMIHLGVDFDYFSKPCTEHEKKELRTKYSLPESFFLFVSNIKPHKNIRILFEAYKRYSIDFPTVLVGKKTGLLHPDSTIFSGCDQKIISTGSIPDSELRIFYQCATGFIYPSLYEGFGLPPLEAMSASCPVIASNLTSIPEVCKDAAYYINPYSPKELSEAMNEIASNQKIKDSLIQKGIYLAKQYPWSKTADQYFRRFHQVIEE